MTPDTTLLALLGTAIATAFIHTIAGPDHYLPFIAIAKSRGYTALRALFWTLVCGIGHVGSALLVAAIFVCFSRMLTEANMQWFEDHRANLAAWALIGFGAAYLLYSLRQRWLHRHEEHRHGHHLVHATDKKDITPWVVFIIFVLGPCEALLPLLTASSVLGTGSVIAVTLVFSACTIATMMAAVYAGIKGLDALRIHWLEHYASEIAGCTIMLCGIAIGFLGL